ncbi:MAG: PfkB family carbohydrate kinase [Rhizobiaceae bacterium]
MEQTPSAVISVSSHVVIGSVGNRSAVPAIELSGLSCWSVPTVILPFHPGHGKSGRIVPDEESFALLLEDILSAPWLGEVKAVASGYLASASQAVKLSQFIKLLKERNRDILYVCDPVIGDSRGLYIAGETAGAIRDLLLPLADFATPNRHELAWLVSSPEAATPMEAAAQARKLGVRGVLVTSAPAFMRGNTGNLLVSDQLEIMAEHRLVNGPPNGAGDLTTGLLTAHLVKGKDMRETLRLTTASVFEAVARASGRASPELQLALDWSSILKPSAMITLRNLATPVVGRK